MKTRIRNFNTVAIIFSITLLTNCTNMKDTSTIEFDTVILNGRVMDPESGLDSIINIGIKDGRIIQVTGNEIKGGNTIDASSQVVAPGFIDLHAHGQNQESYELMVQDGVTTAFELEVGTWDVPSWYAERDRGQLINYGVSVGHIQVRMQVMGDSGDFLPADLGGSKEATEEDIQKMKSMIEKGLEDGAVGIGFGLAYTPAATPEEFETMLSIGEKAGTCSFIHLRQGIEGLEEAIQGVQHTKASLHIVHINSTGGPLTTEFLDRIVQARNEGLDITTEAYPYEAGMTLLESALFDDWQSWDDEKIGQLQWVETGEFLTRETLPVFRKQGGAVIIHERTEEMTLAAIKNPITMIASDGFFENGKGHPRTSGTNAKILRKYVREMGVFSLMEALRRMTIEPARRLDSYVPGMKKKGRIKEGADADIVIFDPETVTDHASYTDPGLPSEGIKYVLVNGEMTVKDDMLQTGVRAGKPVRKD